MFNVGRLDGAAFFGRVLDSSSIREDLLSQNEPRQLAALQQILAFMTVGRDMSGLFSDIAPLCSSTNLTIKRIVYLYLMNNSRSQPEKSVLQAGTFVKDTLNDSPLIRGVALRTMTSLLVPVMVDFITAPLQRCLGDSDAYVRHIAAFATLKLYYVAPNVCEETGILEKLKEQIHDSNPYVVSSAVAAITELLQRNAPVSLESVIVENLTKLLEAAHRVTGWYQHYLLEGIALAFRNKTSVIGIEEGTRIVDGVIPFLSALNVATVVSAVKIITVFLLQTSSLMAPPGSDGPLMPLQERYGPKLIETCVSLLYCPYFEARYAALRNIRLLLMTELRRYFRKHASKFFVKHDDPIYIKLEKADLLLELADTFVGEMILFEYAAYATAEDEELVRKSVRSIGFLAVKVEALAPRCVEQLVQLINTGVSCVVQDAAVVIQTLLRRYPNQFTGVVQKLCDVQGNLTSSESKSAMAWVIGEFADHMDNVWEILEVFLDNFMSESPSVQLTLLTAVVKIYLKSNEESIGRNKSVLERILAMTTHSLLPDIRDRAFIYWRLITNDREVAKRLILISTQATSFAGVNSMDQSRLHGMLLDVGQLTSVLHRPLHLIFDKNATLHENEDEDEEENLDPNVTGFAGGIREDGALITNDNNTIGSPLISNPGSPCGQGGMSLVLSAEEGSGLQVHMAWIQQGSKIVLACRFSLMPGEDYVRHIRLMTLQINRNMFAIGLAQECPVIQIVLGEKEPDTVHLLTGTNNEKEPTRHLLVGINAEPIGTRYFLAPPISPAILLLPATGCDSVLFAELYRKLRAPAWVIPSDMSPVKTEPSRFTVNSLRLHGLNLVYSKEIPETGLTGLFIWAETIAGQKLLMEASLRNDSLIYLSVRCKDAFLAPVFGEYAIKVFAI